MSKIFNWTVGSIFRTLGRIIAYLSVGALITLILSKSGLKITDILGFEKVYASETVTTNLNKYYLRWLDTNNNTTWSDSVNMGTATTYNSSLGSLDAVRARFGSSSNFTKGTKYRVKVNLAFGNANTANWYNGVRDVACAGSASSSWSSNADLIDSCVFVAKVAYEVNGNYRAHYYFDIVPNTTIYGFQVNFYFSNVNYINLGSVNVMSSSNVTYDTDATDAINNSTTSIINNNNENTENIINNQNQNTQDIINNQNELLGSKCPNLLDFNNGNTYTLTATRNDHSVITSYYVPLEANKTYYVKWNSNKVYQDSNSSDSSEIYLLKDGAYNSIIQIKGKEYTIHPSVSGNYYVRVDCNKNGETCTFYNLMISETNKPYCKYGSYLSKQDETTQSVNDLKDSINDDDTDEAVSEASDFFNDFDDDDHGLSSILTAPLNSIRLMLTDTCVAPYTTFHGKTVSLPCGSMLWNRPGASNLKDFLNVVYGGLIAYFFVANLFTWINQFKNPDNDKIEVTDL